MCVMVPLQSYQQHLDFHHTDITCSFTASLTNTLFFSLSLSDTLCEGRELLQRHTDLIIYPYPRYPILPLSYHIPPPLLPLKGVLC